MKDSFWATAKSIIIQAFTEEMGKIGKVSENVIVYLLESGIEHWSKHT